MFNITTIAGQKLALLSIKIGKLKIRVRRKTRTETGSATTLRLVTIYVMDVHIQLHNLNTFATPKMFQSKPANSINKGVVIHGPSYVIYSLVVYILCRESVHQVHLCLTSLIYYGRACQLC